MAAPGAADETAEAQPVASATPPCGKCAQKEAARAALAGEETVRAQEPAPIPEPAASAEAAQSSESGASYEDDIIQL